LERALIAHRNSIEISCFWPLQDSQHLFWCFGQFVSIYRRRWFSETPRLGNSLSYSRLLFPESYWHSLSYMIMLYVIISQNPYKAGYVRKQQK
jgi:hypothetical protein